MLVKMVLQPRHAGVPLIAPAERALEGLHVGVGDLVGLQVALGDESVAALVAHERSFSSVRAEVSLEVAGFDELLEALLERTDEYFLFILGPGRFEHS
jgi:hypothetical protein